MFTLLLLVAAIGSDFTSRPVYKAGTDNVQAVHKMGATDYCGNGSIVRMRAYNTVSLQWVYWRSCGVDSTGSGSGVTTANLTQITEVK